MNGITIINSIDINTLAFWQFVVGMIPLIISAIIYFVKLHTALKNRTLEEQNNNTVSFDNKNLLIIFIGGLLSFIFLFSMGKYCPAEYIETQYEIKIDNSVSFYEVYDNYSILAEKDNTFIVVEKN